MEIKYSLVVATVGRKKEIDLLLNSLSLQTIDKNLFEVILVDQNQEHFIAEYVQYYSSKLNIVHIRSNRLGLSYNRNLGIAHSKGIYIAVPDDDCEYYPDTLQKADEQLKALSYPDMIIGRVYNRKEKKYVFKRSPNVVIKITPGNFYQVVSSIALVFKKGPVLFDEAFGIGGNYPSNEDGELILNFLQKKKEVYYSPEIEFNHPPYDTSNLPIDKLYRYGIGFGAMCKKYLSIPIAWLFVKVIGFQCLMIARETLCLNFTQVRRRFTALKGRLKGYMLYTRPD